MGVLVLLLKIFGTWSAVAVVTGLSLGAMISRGERARKEEFLSYIFSSLESIQASSRSFVPRSTSALS
jgi:hypothetical protein